MLLTRHYIWIQAALIGFLYGTIVPLCGQESFVSQTSIAKDSLDQDIDTEETLYRINVLRLQRWVKENLESLDDPVVSAEVARLIREADNFAKTGDFQLANIWLETVWEILVPAASEVASGAATSALFNSDETEIKPNDDNPFWSREIISGIDFWRQRFDLTFLERDSSYSEGNGNPYSGIRLTYNNEFEPGNRFESTSFFKYSRDYLAGEITGRYAGSFGRWRLQLQNRFEGTSFYNDIDLKYWQNVTTAAIQHRLGAASLTVEDDFLVRRYADVDTTYPDYYENTFTSYAKLNFGLASLAALTYRNVQRLHPDLNVYDYVENRIALSWQHSFSGVLRFSLEDEVRFRDYRNAPADHFLQDFWENYALAKLDFALTPKFGVELNGALTKRDYSFVNVSSLPDFTFWEVEPDVYFRLGDWKVATGFYYGRETHQKLADRLSAVDAANAFGIFFEDYNLYGPVVTVDFFNTKGFLLSLREAFLLRRYPNASANNIDSFSLYSDRNTNSILFYMTWSATRHWTINVLANMDDERGRHEDAGDSQNTLVGFELSYSF